MPSSGFECVWGSPPALLDLPVLLLRGHGTRAVSHMPFYIFDRFNGEKN